MAPIAVVVAAILTQTISARRTRERELATARALTQRETARELGDRVEQAWEGFIDFDGKPPKSMEAVRRYLGEQAPINTLSYRLDDDDTGKAIRDWIAHLQRKAVARTDGEPPMPSAEWDQLKEAHDTIQKSLGTIYRASALDHAGVSRSR